MSDQLKKYMRIIFLSGLFLLLLTGCGTAAKLADGEYSVNITMEGGSGRASVASSSTAVIEGDMATVELVWSSPNYDYMVVGDKKYLNEAQPGENSIFHIEVPVEKLSEPLEAVADTTAMSVPHEIAYTFYFEMITEASEIDFQDLELTSSVELRYATEFSIDQYGEYKLVTIVQNGRFLLIPKNYPIPRNLPEDVTALQMPLDRTYLVASSAMDLLCTIGAEEHVRFSGTRESDWYVEKAAAAMRDEKILFAGKYSAPDYELLVSGNCGLAIENTMILHSPEVKEKLEELGIPVMVERSSYESHPLGRLEWIRLYGALFDAQDEADTFFEQQCRDIEPIAESENTGVRVAVFFVNSNGVINVRKPNDYLSKMIEMAGGKYALSDVLVEEENALSTMNMQMEDFYSAARDADILIYNSTIDGELRNIEDLIEKNGLFADFDAVKGRRVYCTAQNFFQQTSGMTNFIGDVNQLLRQDSGSYRYLRKLE